MTKTMKEIMNKEQLDMCYEDANKLAKLLLDKDVSKQFGKDGNANYALNTTVIITAGILACVAKSIKLDPKDLLHPFFQQVIDVIDCHNKNPNLYLVQ